MKNLQAEQQMLKISTTFSKTATQSLLPVGALLSRSVLPCQDPLC
jgi:hypothetical protein